MKVYLIFGGSGKIGDYYINNYLDTKKDKVIVVDTQAPNRKDIIFFRADAVNNLQYNEIQQYLKSKELSIDFILYTIGIEGIKNVFNSSLSDFSKIMDINVNGFFIAVKMLQEYLSKNASIVAIGSQNGVVGHEDRIVYGPSKAALIQMIKNMTIDFSKYDDRNIRFNCISPGYILTESHYKKYAEYELNRLISKNLQKKSIDLESIAYTIDFLFDKRSSPIIGQNIVLDYGFTII